MKVFWVQYCIASSTRTGHFRASTVEAVEAQVLTSFPDWTGRIEELSWSQECDYLKALLKRAKK